MPNWCYGELRIKGRKEDKKKFLNLFLENDSNNEDKKQYFARSWIAGYPTSLEEELDKDITICNVEVAWSVYSCMINGYPDEISTLTLEQATKLYNVKIEIGSYEQGMCFREFYQYDNGELTKRQVDDFPEDEYKEENYSNEDDYQEARDNWYYDIFYKFSKEFTR